MNMEPTIAGSTPSPWIEGGKLLVAGFLGAVLAFATKWVERRQEHQRHLRLMLAELKRLAQYRDRYPSQPLLIRGFTRPQASPSPASFWMNLMADVNFRLTDRHDYDNSQERLIDLVRLCDEVKILSDRVFDRIEWLRHWQEAGGVVGGEYYRQVSLEEHWVKAHHQALRDFLATVEAAEADVSDRLLRSGLWRQAWRAITGANLRLPAAVPPSEADKLRWRTRDLTVDPAPGFLAELERNGVSVVTDEWDETPTQVTDTGPQ